LIQNTNLEQKIRINKKEKVNSLENMPKRKKSESVCKFDEDFEDEDVSSNGEIQLKLRCFILYEAIETYNETLEQ
jgi:hypothetical protein